MRIFLLISILFSVLAVHGQNKQLIYNFSDLPQSLMTNPGAETTFDMHVGIPFLSQVHIAAGSSGVSFHDIFQSGSGSINDRLGSIIRDMSRNDFFNVNQQLEIIYVGWRDKKKRYYTAGVYQEADVFLYFPKDPAVLAYEGNSGYIGEDFNMSDAAFTAEVLNVFHIGFTNYYSENLNYGFRGKLYSGMFNASSTRNRGIFRTEVSPEGPNLYRHYLNGLDVLINTSGWADLEESENPSGIGALSRFGKRGLLAGNLGLGLDVGFTWYPKERYRVTGSILDLGFVHQTKNVENYHYYGDYQTDGIELLFPGSGENQRSYWDEWENDLDRRLKDKTYTNNYFTWRPVKLNASVDFGFDENVEVCNCHKPSGRRRYFHHVGAQFYAIKRPRGMNYATTLYFGKVFNQRYRGKVTYTADSYSFSNIGLLFSARLSNFNVYLAADNLLDYTNLARARNASLQLGMQFIFNRD